MISQLNYGGIEPAYRRLLEKLEREGYKIDYVEKINHDRYIIAHGKYQDPFNILIMFKREELRNFTYEMRLKGFKGMGDSANVSDLKYAVTKEVQGIFTIFANGRVYYISMEDFLVKSERQTLREGKEVRTIQITDYIYQFNI